MLDIKDSVIVDKNQEIERLEARIRFAYSTIGQINKTLKDFEKRV